MTNEIKPAKKHYNRFLSKMRAAWVGSIDEAIGGISKGTIATATSKDTFKPHYPTELALSYGLNKGLIRLGELDGKYYPIFFTKKGYTEVEKLQQTTCAFTGRRIRQGAF